MSDDAVKECLGGFSADEMLAGIFADSEHLQDFVIAFRGVLAGASQVQGGVQRSIVSFFYTWAIRYENLRCFNDSCCRCSFKAKLILHR